MKDIQKMIDEYQEGFEAEITKVEPCKSTDFFGVTKFDERNGYRVSVLLVSESVNQEWDEFFNVPKITGLTESKIFKFKQKYGDLPKKGMKVKAIIDKDGFLRIQL